MIQDMAVARPTLNANKKPYQSFQMVLFSVTSDPDFKITPLFVAEYQRQYEIHYSGIRMSTYTHALFKGVISNDVK